MITKNTNIKKRNQVFVVKPSARSRGKPQGKPHHMPA